ncbi:hypothetical protein UNSWDHB_2921 [Dehalobacter sp. UNSWDHB]|nr:hypothetical protein UNSWDHB_2921 [Dehalobacter sp. UNSWDHB]
MDDNYNNLIMGEKLWHEIKIDILGGKDILQEVVLLAPLKQPVCSLKETA